MADVGQEADRLTHRDDDVDFAEAHIKRLVDIIRGISLAEIAALISEIRRTYKRDAVSWFMGNGGKSAIAAEWANDLSAGVRTVNPPIRAGSFCENGPMLTAIANDFDYSEVFSRQVRIYTRPGDLVVGMSGSGHSQNVLDGLRQAKQMGLRTAAIVGMDGGRITGDYRRYIDTIVHVPSQTTEDGPIEDSMLALCHLVVMRFRDVL